LVINFWQHESRKWLMNLPQGRLSSLFSLTALALLALLVLSALPQHAAPPAPSSELFLVLDPAASKVHWTLGTTLHTVHGTFALKKGALQLDLANGKIGGEIIVDAASGNSGDDSRDKKMHKDVLESGRYTEVVFRPDRVEGKIALQGSSKVQIHGILTLHGVEHELTVPVEAELTGDHWVGSAKFSVPFIDWGLKNPSSFLLKVKHSVDIELELKGSAQSPVTP
jgi:polyisoprenoid-binding protein YceI